MEEAKRTVKKQFGKNVNLSSGKKMIGKSSKGNWYRFEWTKKGKKKHDPVKELKKLELKISR